MKIHKTPLIYIITTIFLFFNAIMLIFPKEIIRGAKNGLLLWYNNVIPTLLPFMIFTAMLIKTGFPQRLGRICAPLCQRLFNISGEGAFAIAAGVISGCPLGAKTACDLYRENLLSKSEAQRLAIFCNNTGPLFVTGVVGEAMLHSPSAGALILLCQYISAFVLCAVYGIFAPKAPRRSRKSTPCGTDSLFSAFSESVMEGVNGITAVGGFIVIFSVICSVFDSCGIPALISRLVPFEHTEGIIAAALEITNGMAKLTKGNISMPLISAAAAWGGFSIHAQSAAFITDAGLSVKKYILGKLLQAFAAYMICLLLCSIINI